MISEFLKSAENGETVYISTVFEAFQSLKEHESQVLNCYLSLLEIEQVKCFTLRIPIFSEDDKKNLFIKEYVWAELYNIISSLGGRKMDVYVDISNRELTDFAENLNSVFDIDKARKDRGGYGRSVNVTDRMLETLAPEEEGFRFIVKPVTDKPQIVEGRKSVKSDMSVYSKVIRDMENKVFCGIDVGGTDIKIALVKNGDISCYKEFDWFPAKFTQSIELVDPICLLVRLMRAKITLDSLSESSKKSELSLKMENALHISASKALMTEICDEIESLVSGQNGEIDAVGMCFPDVVVKNKIVGGEVYKTRGIRNNSDINYEEDFKTLTDLNDRIGELIKDKNEVHIINDGPMASFTAAVEIAASRAPESITDGVFAHTLGTELGTGWVDESGSIPDIPLEVYNYIIDLGSYIEKQYHPDDLRSINNFNTGLPGTLQKYASQSGVFRLALKYFPKERPDLLEEIKEKGFVQEIKVNGKLEYSVPSEPVDQRKAFLEFMMSLPEREGDSVNERIWRELGEFLAVTWLETKKILNPQADSRFIFGRLVKRKRCFDLMVKGAQRIKKDISFEIADSTLANTELMKKLEADPHYTVAQFAQAIGAAYFANK